jgi:hypothetical protein
MLWDLCVVLPLYWERTPLLLLRHTRFPFCAACEAWEPNPSSTTTSPPSTTPMLPLRCSDLCATQPWVCRAPKLCSPGYPPCNTVRVGVATHSVGGATEAESLPLWSTSSLLCPPRPGLLVQSTLSPEVRGVSSSVRWLVRAPQDTFIAMQATPPPRFCRLPHRCKRPMSNSSA